VWHLVGGEEIQAIALCGLLDRLRNCSTAHQNRRIRLQCGNRVLVFQQSGELCWHQRDRRKVVFQPLGSGDKLFGAKPGVNDHGLGSGGNRTRDDGKARHVLAATANSHWPCPPMRSAVAFAEAVSADAVNSVCFGVPVEPEVRMTATASRCPRWGSVISGRWMTP